MKKKKIKIVALSDGAGGVDFEVDGVKAKHARLHLEKDSGTHEIEFELHDQSGKELGFDLDDPIWVGEDCDCPPPSGINSDQMTVTGREERSLSTVNLNSGRGRDLRYQLNFIRADGSREICDPIIRNDGGRG
jgi:hypothetical protein